MDISLTKLLAHYFNKEEWIIQESESVFPAIKGVCDRTVTKITEIKNKKTGIKVLAEVFEDDNDIKVGLYSLCGYAENEDELNAVNENGIVSHCVTLGGCNLDGWIKVLMMRNHRREQTDKILSVLNGQSGQIPLSVDVDLKKGGIYYGEDCHHAIREKDGKWGLVMFTDGEADIVFPQ